MPRAKPRRRKKVSDLRHIATRLTQRFFQMGKKLAEKEGWVFYPVITDGWLRAIENSFRWQDESLIVRDLAYFMAWAKETKVNKRSFPRDQIQATGDADYLDQMRAFYRRNTRTIAEFFLELSAA